MSDNDIVERANHHSDEEDEDAITFDDILSTRIGFGIY